VPDSKKLVSVEVASLQERIIQLCIIAPKRQMLGKGEAVRKIDDEPAMAAMESLDNIRWTAISNAVAGRPENGVYEGGEFVRSHTMAR